LYIDNKIKTKTKNKKTIHTKNKKQTNKQTNKQIKQASSVLLSGETILKV
jgi:hypothetical protein